ncbi:MAG: hypothetical protein ABI647_10345 [Gemmatimonadota bacterium]
MPSQKKVPEEYQSSPPADEIRQPSAFEERRHHDHHGSTEDVVRLLTAILTQVKNEPFLRPPPLSPAAEDAIELYEITSAALNPGRSPLFDVID